MSVRTRNKVCSIHWLIGGEASDVSGSKLPSKRQALSHFLYHHTSLRKTKASAATDTVRNIGRVWQTARVVEANTRDSVVKLLKLFSRYTRLNKDRKLNGGHGGGKPHEIRLAEFVNELDDLFDIAHHKSLILTEKEEDRQFLIAQRKKGRQGSMLTVRDFRLATKEKNRAERQEAARKQKIKEQQERLVRFSSVRSDSLEEPGPSPEKKKKSEEEDYAVGVEGTNEETGLLRGKRTVFTPQILDMMDRCKMSNKKGAAMVIAVLGQDAAAAADNKSTLHRARLQHRKERGAELLSQCTIDAPLSLHWDGKLLSDITGLQKVNRLPVVVSNGEQEKLLGVPKLFSGTGLHEAVAVTTLVNDYNLREKIVAVGFDTTTSNTGNEKGACQYVEGILAKPLLWLACRHHVFEVVLKYVFLFLLGPLKGPTCAMFERFKTQWENIDTSRPCLFTDESIISAAERQIITQFRLDQLQLQQPRSDYVKLLEMCLIFLGATPPRGVKFDAPGDLSEARWMARATYSLYMYILQDQLSVSARDKKGLLDMCLFVVRVYIRSWFTAHLATAAPRNDLAFLKSVVEYGSANAEVSNVASMAFSRHLWYLSNELVGLTFLDDEVGTDMKRLMLLALKENQGTPSPPKRLNIGGGLSMARLATVELHELITTNTMTFFTMLGAPTGFLSVDPALWDNREDYILTRKMARGLKVVNDCAERGVALIKEYTEAALTKDESQLQYLLQLVKDHREQFPQLTKCEILKSFDH